MACEERDHEIARRAKYLRFWAEAVRKHLVVSDAEGVAINEDAKCTHRPNRGC